MCFGQHVHEEDEPLMHFCAWAVHSSLAPMAAARCRRVLGSISFLLLPQSFYDFSDLRCREVGCHQGPGLAGGCILCGIHGVSLAFHAFSWVCMHAFPNPCTTCGCIPRFSLLFRPEVNATRELGSRCHGFVFKGPEVHGATPAMQSRWKRGKAGPSMRSV